MIKIENRDLKEKLEGLCNKQIEQINENDLEKITAITMNAKDNLGNSLSNKLEDLNYFTHLENLTLRNYEITPENGSILKALPKLDSLELVNCQFKERTKWMLNIRSLRIHFCNNVDIREIFANSRIQNIVIENGNNINLKKLNNIMDLQSVTLDEMIISRNKIKALLKCNAENILLNNCKISVLAKRKIKELMTRKNVRITNQKLVL